MRRRAILRSVGSGVVVLTTGSGLVAADTQTQREAAKDHVVSEYNADKENLVIINEAVASWSELDEHYYQPKVYDKEDKVTYRFLLDGDSQTVDRDDLHRREEEDYNNKYEKYSPSLYREVQDAKPDEEFFVRVKISYDQIDWKQIESNANENTKDLEQLRQELSNRRKESISKTTRKIANNWKDLSSVSIVNKEKGL